VRLTEEDLNAWSASMAPDAPPPEKKPATPPKAGAKPAGPPAPEGLFIPSVPNFRIVEGKLQIGMKCTLNWNGMMTDVILQATGGFRRDPEGYVFVPDKVYLGSCPVHLLPAAAGPLVAYITAHEKAPDAIRTAWAKLGSVAIDGNFLKLAVQ
jgi:hypothetical protein